MRVGILGSGDVATSLGRGFLKEGHEVMLGSREPEKPASWGRESGQSSSSGTFSETAKFGELLVITVNGVKAVEAVQTALGWERGCYA
jgi:predicted dinucleotide-binding enzyme